MASKIDIPVNKLQSFLSQLYDLKIYATTVTNDLITKNYNTGYTMKQSTG